MALLYGELYWLPLSYATMLKFWRERGAVASSMIKSFNLTFRNYVLEPWTNDISHATMLGFTLRRKKTLEGAQCFSFVSNGLIGHKKHQFNAIFEIL